MALLGALAARCGDAAGAGSGTPPAVPPNVVMIVMDTTRADRCSINGYARPTTPQLERLAEGGTVFLDCWSPAPWTGPAHASLFTGLRASRHHFTEATQRLDAAEVTLAELLRDAGYRTGCFTANSYVTPQFGLTQGFQRVAAPSAERQLASPTAEATHAAAGDWALATHAKGERFFLFINDMEPHAPYTPPDEDVRRVARFVPDPRLREAATFAFPRPLLFSLGVLKLPDAVLSAASDLYDGEIASLDRQIGLLLERLRLAGALDNTLVIVAGDHGENLGDHGLGGHVFSLHRTLLHVPLLIRGPGIAKGRKVTETVRLEDVFPTVLELCSVPVPGDLDGASLLGDVGGRIARATVDRPVAALRHAAGLAPDTDRTPFDVSLSSVYDGRHHLIRASDGREWLYDVPNDPGERIDGRRVEGEAATRLRALLDR